MPKNNEQSGVKKYTAPHSPIMLPDKSAKTFTVSD